VFWSVLLYFNKYIFLVIKNIECKTMHGMSNIKNQQRNVLITFVMKVVVMMGGEWNWISLMSSRGLQL
jgi:hypothetical protein